MRSLALALTTSVLAFATPAAAQTAVTSLPTTNAGPATADGTTFVSSASDTRANSDGSQSSATLQATSPISGNGSIEIQGNRSRVFNNMTGLGIAGNTLVSLTADYQVNGSPDGVQSPAFRVYLGGTNTVNGFGGSSELIWEAANNGGYTAGQPDTVGASDLFWRQIVGRGFDGTGGVGQGGYRLLSLAQWGDLLNGSVLGIGVGNGGCPVNCSTFDAFADNLALTTDTASYRYDFQVASAVPEPATWAMMLIGFGAVGGMMRRRSAVRVRFA